MAAIASTSAGDGQNNNSQPSPSDRLKLLYPAVNEEDTPLPRSWSPKDKYNFIGLSQNNLRVHYKGVGKTHKDAASVRATHPIPASCGIYYFEVKIISKGRDGANAIDDVTIVTTLRRLLTGYPEIGTWESRDATLQVLVGGCDPPMVDIGSPYGDIRQVIQILFRPEKRSQRLRPSKRKYMGVGLSAQGVNMNRLPGWDKHSYGYHGDDGHSFCSSGTGQPYGPTFTTGDVIGCCVNLIDNTCFYTKNGVNLGIAFRDLPPNLYPTVGLQTPGEVVEANFGNSPFVFDIEDYMREWRMKTRLTIQRFPVLDKKGEWQTALQKIVSTYLVHHGYCATAESFARNTGQAFEEELASIKNRQRIQRLVLAGRMGEAIETTKQLYPGLLERDANLLFMLKCRQFIEMVNGTDSEVRGPAIRSPKSRHSSGSARSSPSMSPVHYPINSSVSTSSVITSARSANSGSLSGSSGGSSPNRIQTSSTTKGQQQQQHSTPPGMHPASNNNSATSTTTTSSSSTSNTQAGPNSALSQGGLFSEAEMNAANSAMNGDNSQQQQQQQPRQMPGGPQNPLSVPQIHMDTSDVDMADGSSENGADLDRTAVRNGTSNGLCANGVTDIECDMEVDPPSSKRQLCGGNPLAIEKMLQYGRELQAMSVQLRREYGKNEANKKALQDAFSLLAYQDPWNSPVGHQLDPVQREPICAALNSSILESHGLPKQPPLELAIGQATECMKLMSKSGIGSCAFANVSQYLQ